MANPSSYDKPLPDVTSLTKPFWDYCRKHELRMQFCSSCNQWIWYPRAWCPSCGKRDALEWKRLSGTGIIYSFTVIRQVIDNSPAFNKDLPFIVGLVALDEGPRIYSNVIGAGPENLSIGDKVELFFDDVTEGISLPKFRRSP
jgi:uncharacterized OB-fold protein